MLSWDILEPEDRQVENLALINRHEESLQYSFLSRFLLEYIVKLFKEWLILYLEDLAKDKFFVLKKVAYHIIVQGSYTS